MLKSVIVSLVLAASVSSFAAGKNAEKDSKIKEACSAEITASGCTGKDFGKGLMKCMHEYKQAHKDFVISESCKGVKHEMKAARQAKKGDMKPAGSKE